jgi:hypothetical protein
VAVRRKDVDLDTKEGREMAMLDNLTSQVNLAWDEVELESVSDQVEGFDPTDFGWEPQDIGDIGDEKEPRSFDDPDDISDKIQISYKVEIDCADEKEQESLFNELKERGLKCRILTL